MNPILEGFKEKLKKELNLASPQLLRLQRDRLGICNMCDYQESQPVKRCAKCGCFLELKTLVRDEECVLQKW
jgi:hypothetical protein